MPWVEPSGTVYIIKTNIDINYNHLCPLSCMGIHPAFRPAAPARAVCCPRARPFPRAASR